MITILRQLDSSTLVNQSYIDQYNAIQDASIAELFSTETVSRTIYVDASGSDITGDGSVARLPYASIGKALNMIGRDILSGVITTINIGVGNFTLSSSDLDTLSQISGAGSISMQGTLVLCASSFTINSSLASDPLTYNVSGGSTSTWTSNQWKYYFLKSTTNYFPITADTSTTLSITRAAATGSEIYQAQTVIQLNGNNIDLKVPLALNYVNLALTDNTVILSKNRFDVTSCYFSSSGKSLMYKPTTQYSILSTAFSNIRLILQSEPWAAAIKGCYIFYNTNQRLITVNPTGFPYVIQDTVFENPNTGSLASCISNFNQIYNTDDLINYLKFINSNIAFAYTDQTYFYETRPSHKIILVNTNYLLRKNTTNVADYGRLIFIFKYSNIYGTPNTRWFYDPMYEFVNLSSNRNIQITGFLYPEFEQNQTYNLVNNSVTDISIGNALQNESISINYEITRSIGLANGAFSIMIDSSGNLYTSTDKYTSSGITAVQDPAITFDVILDTSIVKLRATLDSSGGDASINYNINRVMRTPLII
jgi:hypothetical protein